MIPCKIPEHLVQDVARGVVRRYGTLLKDVNTGRIRGHLVPVGEWQLTMSKLPVNPIETLSMLGEHYQLAKIQKTLSVLQLTTNIGSLCSVATLGLCVAGFIVIGNQLNKLNSHLDLQLKEIQAVKQLLVQLNIKWDAFSLATLHSAIEQLHVAEHASEPSRRSALLEHACDKFTNLKHYYSCLFKSYNFWLDGSLSMYAAADLYSRFLSCCLGQLHAEFLLGDFRSFAKTWELVNTNVAQISQFDAIQALRTRTDYAISGDIISKMALDTREIKEQIEFAKSIADESQARIETLIYNVRYVEMLNIPPYEYVKTLRELDSHLAINFES